MLISACLKRGYARGHTPLRAKKPHTLIKKYRWYLIALRGKLTRADSVFRQQYPRELGASLLLCQLARFGKIQRSKIDVGLGVAANAGKLAIAQGLDDTGDADH